MTGNDEKTVSHLTTDHLSWELTGVVDRITTTQFFETGRRSTPTRVRMANIPVCRAEETFGKDVPCLLIDPQASNSEWPNCRLCPAMQSTRDAFTKHIDAGGPWMPLFQFVQQHMTLNKFFVMRRFRAWAQTIWWTRMVWSSC
jgi:hypothetical protein